MDFALDNIYQEDDAITDVLARVVQGNHIDDAAICVLLQNSMVSPKIKEEVLYTVASKNPDYRRTWIEFIKTEIVYLHNSSLFIHYRNYLNDKIKLAYLMTESDVVQTYNDLTFLIANGYAELYPYIWLLFSRQGNATSANSAEFRAMSYYSVVFEFDGYNGRCIKEQLKRSASYREGELEFFATLKSPIERAFAEYGRAMLSIMRDAFKKRHFNDDKFEKHLLAIPREYKDKLHVATLLRNSERLYNSFRRFFEDGGVYRVHYFPFNDDKQTGV